MDMKVRYMSISHATNKPTCIYMRMYVLYDLKYAVACPG